LEMVRESGGEEWEGTGLLTLIHHEFVSLRL
jgi:hypothetical protein